MKPVSFREPALRCYSLPLTELDHLGLRENTLVVFWSDHGYHLAEHGLGMKESCFEESARVPMIIVPPRTKNAGKSCERTVELLDLYPTIADYAGHTQPKDLQGYLKAM